jgi:hypothetical protein
VGGGCQHLEPEEADRCLCDYRQPKDQKPGNNEVYQAHLEQLGTQIESVQDFWRYNNNTPVDQIKMRESIYLFKSGFKPIWEDRRNINGGSWTFRVPKSIGPDFWTRVQLLAIGEKLQSDLDEGMRLNPIPTFLLLLAPLPPPSKRLPLTKMHMYRRSNLRRRSIRPIQLTSHLHLAS